MTKSVSLTIDGENISVPEGTLIVDAAKKIGIDIPVFCYHPKMEPVGMCRMCLVEVGRPLFDRATGDLVLQDDGTPEIQFNPKLETACTTPVSEGMVVRGLTDKAKAGRKDIVEFLLTSHPLDCPICDKGGECPLQNLTMGFGPGASRFIYGEKIDLAKHVSLGELIFLDRERCIQCARCVRFQDEIVDEPVIGFYNRGRSLEIVTYSEPGFDSYFSGNTTDICPVGALTTADFRFGARPWEMNSAASICTQCPVGCNITLNVRREAKTGGGWAVKRVMPRQHEAVNEIWICDKGRFTYHYAESDERITTPMIRKDGQLTPASWDEALEVVAGRFREAGSGLLTLASGRLSNEDLFNIRKMTAGVGGKPALYTTMGGGDLTPTVGVGQGTNFSGMGEETAILVVGCDLQEEAPLWWLRVKQAADRGSKLIVLNPRATRLDKYAQHLIHYGYGEQTIAVLSMLNSLSKKHLDIQDEGGKFSKNTALQAAAEVFAQAENGIVIFGSEGTGWQDTQELAQACANLLIATNHTGRANNGLIGVWQRVNEQGAWDMGFRPVDDMHEAMHAASALYVVAADPAGDNPKMAETTDFLVVQDLFLTDTAKLADVVLPAKSFIEREGSFTSGERRVQRYYPAVPARPGCLADFEIAGRLGKALGIELEDRSASKVMTQIAREVPNYAEISYIKLTEVSEQWPIVGRGDLYYGGTTYENLQGMGAQLAPAAQHGESPTLFWTPPTPVQRSEGLTAVPVTRLYDRGQTVVASKLLQSWIPQPYIMISPQDARELDLPSGSTIQVNLNGTATLVNLRIDAAVPEGFVLVPRSFGIPIFAPSTIEIKLSEPVAM